LLGDSSKSSTIELSRETLGGETNDGSIKTELKVGMTKAGVADVAAIVGRGGKDGPF
jgi:hypothetical protein